MLLLHEQAEMEILREINRKLLKGADVTYLRGLMDNVNAVLKDLRAGSLQWTEEVIPAVYQEGIKLADAQLARLGLEAATGFGAIHQQAVQILADAAFDRLDGSIQTIGRRVDDIYRKAALETTRQAVIGYKTYRQVAKEFAADLDDRGITGFRDARGREWNMKSYASMVARTTTMEAHINGTANRIVESGRDLVKVSDHPGECEKCRPWEGKVLSLTGKTPGYPTFAEARGKGLFHPNCEHALGLEIDLDAEIEAAERQAGSGVPKPKPKHYVDIPGLSEDAKTGLAQAFAEALDHGLKTNTECLIHADAKTGVRVYNKVSGEKDRVVFPPDLIDFLNKAPERSIILVHNHPNSSSFSPQDLMVAGRFGSLAGVTIMGHDGTRYYAAPRVGSAIDPNKIWADWDAARSKYFNHYRGLVISGKMTEDEAWKEHTHRILEDVAQADGLDYMRWLPNE